MNRPRCLPCVAAIGFLAAAVACADASAQTTGPAADTRNEPRAAPANPGGESLPAPKLEPLPEITSDAELEPQITIKRKGGETVEEARVNGRLVWIKVTPSHGKAYYLIPSVGGNTYIRRDSLVSGLSVPMWVLFTF